VCTPNRERTLVASVSLTVEPGEGLLIAGASGRGKTSLLRAIAGLWTEGSGRVERPALDQLLFLPQQPYMVLGSLRSQLAYGRAGRAIADAGLRAVLERVSLGALADRFGGLDAERDWTKVLSIREQQRLPCARVRLAAPRYVLLDEATSALDRANEDNLYRQLDAIDTTPISVSHRAALLPFHRQVLEVLGDGSWRLVPAAGYRFDDGDAVSDTAGA
jgi:putative ATP-binding cassette transporter